MKEFQRLHPLVLFFYYGWVIVLSMLFLHPVGIGISLGFALFYAAYLKGRRALRFDLLYLLPLMLLTAIINPAFNHRGVTLLTYFPNGNPLTWESICFGLAAAAMLGAVISWFSCYHVVMTSDKFIYLFGRILPSLSLVLSMTLRFVPRFTHQIKKIYHAQQGLWKDSGNWTWKQKWKSGIRVLSAMVNWALEQSVEIADSMKSRGYGRKGRTAFSIYEMHRRDAVLIVTMLLLGSYLLAGYRSGAMGCRFFPKIVLAAPGLYGGSLWLAYGVMCALPLLWEGRERYRWNTFKSRI